MLFLQTFLPFTSYRKSARVLDPKRLGQQRREVLQILRVLNGEYEKDGKRPWVHHPAVLMWRFHERPRLVSSGNGKAVITVRKAATGNWNALVVYGLAMCDEWVRRGNQDSRRPLIAQYYRPGRIHTPWWLHETPLVLSHRANLLRKRLTYYRKFFPVPESQIGTIITTPYFWPIRAIQGEYHVSNWNDRP